MMFNGIQSKECHDNNPAHSNITHRKLFVFNEINEDIITDKKKSLIHNILNMSIITVQASITMEDGAIE